jgi:hypothetical protein
MKPHLPAWLTLTALMSSHTLAASPVKSGIDSPPDFADSAHVFNGCHVSAVAYVLRFRAAFPQEKAHVFVLSAQNRIEPHSLAVVSWRGAWWAREEMWGVFPLSCTVAKIRDPEQLERVADAVFARRWLADQKLGGRSKLTGPQPLSTPHRLSAVRLAATMLGCASQLCWIRSEGAEVPVLFFRPETGTIALYDPASGTASAECANTDTPAIVAAVAVRLGYAGATVRLEPPLLAANMGPPSRSLGVH